MATNIRFSNTDYDIYKVLKRSLINKIFVGEYLERRYVEKLGVYRDVVVVNSSEVDCIKCIRALNTFLKRVTADNKWIGITEEKSQIYLGMQENVVLWENFQELPLGKYWFKVQGIHFTQKEVLIQLKRLRPYHDNEHNIHEVMDLSMERLREVLTVANFCESAKFIAVVLMTIITFSVNALVFISEYLIRLIYALSTLLNAITPMFYSLLEFFGRIITGLYWLILMLFKGNSRVPISNAPAIMFTSPNRNYVKNYNRRYNR